MNVFYFVRRFPRRFKTAKQQKIFSLSESLINLGHKIHFVSCDLSDPQQYKHFDEYPINLIHISPKKIIQSLTSPKIKPDLAIFSTSEMEQMYSTYLYTKFSKCPRVLEITKATRLQRWRKKKFSVNSQHQIIPYSGKMYDQSDIFSQTEMKSIMRSDYYITPNDFLYFHTMKYLNGESSRLSLLSHGYNMNDYMVQIKQKEYRPFKSRKHFVFLGDMTEDSCIEQIHTLVNRIWPLIKKQLNDSTIQLHIYSSGHNLKIQRRKKQYQKQGIVVKGYSEDLESLLPKYRLLLYPCRFSTSLKGKVLDSWLNHLPVVTTPIGAEGMFWQSLESKFVQSINTESQSGFVNERQFSKQQKNNESKVNSYYSANKLQNKPKTLTFGGSFLNYTYKQFADSAIELYNNQQKWENALKISHKTMIKNQNENQLEINIKSMLNKLDMAVYKTRGIKQYDEQWRRVTLNKEYQKKIHVYKGQQSE